ncbi:DUF4870 domain-containing protein [Salsuginibacillus kocurii]|uniref:DUF4870 domain-containing protein n=1 Tax=Salsuginibacillus kocurii TaxID=427078 RepID=UPI0003692EDA|nr:DUF4870 domain-containing protein [Salsuginibacillus kocurii]
MPATGKGKAVAACGYLIPMVFHLPIISLVGLFFYKSIFKGKSMFQEHHLNENINVQLSVHIYGLALAIFLLFLAKSPGMILPGSSATLHGVAAFVLLGMVLVIYVAWWIGMVIAIIAALCGYHFKFPLTLRIFR